jgi:hypothetical protein
VHGLVGNVPETNKLNEISDEDWEMVDPSYKVNLDKTGISETDKLQKLIDEFSDIF